MEKKYRDYNFLQTVDVLQWEKDSNFIILTILSSRLGCELNNLARNWRVHYDTKAILSAITIIIHVFLFTNARSSSISSCRPDTGYIRKISISHENWFYPFFPRASETFRTLRENFISERLSHIPKEQKSDLTEYVDNVL